ncbi:hypothetical protein EIP91_002539 [Steccherinum ochraceum]|uniref:Protein-S-isoprenylcysteine O-methyltransferase n=1 Tax=Steccherinum ochraceum TaxID=92696 RepID=A0A4R0RBX6_9APHY|nr:hypothetical protein EIP91_002539 [Steccherinum ochraceum]
MSSLVSSAFLAVLNAAAIHLSVTPPSHASPAEQEKFKSNKKPSDGLSFVQLNLGFMRTINAGFCLCNLYMLLATIYPALLPSSVVRTIFAPNFATTLPTAAIFTPSNTYIYGSFVLYFGAYIRLITYRALGRFFTFELSVKDEHKLITTGPYAVVRHPAYFGAIFVCIGLVTVHLFSPGTWWVECGLWSTWYGKVFGVLWAANLSLIQVQLLARVPKEDHVLRQVFGEQWNEWAQKTPYAVIPFVW